MLAMIVCTICGLLVIGGLYWMLLRPERWEWLEGLRNRARRWKYRNVRRTEIGLVIAMAAVFALLSGALPDGVWLSILLALLAAETAIHLLYYRCPECGRAVWNIPGRHCPHCGEVLHWD